MKKSKPLVFFGSGPLSARTFEFVADNFAIDCVITKPQSEHGHKTVPPLEKAAWNRDTKIFFCSRKAELDELFSRQKIADYVGLVVDFGLIIPQSVIDHFKLGIVNSHFSLLPLWRGADPITFSLLAGDKVTGVSLMIINAAMDEGGLIAQSELPVEPDDTAETLTDRLIHLNHRMLIDKFNQYLAGQIKAWPQDPSIEPTYSRKLIKEDGLIDWQKPATQLERQVRAFHRWPKSYTNLADRPILITRAVVSKNKGKPGELNLADGDLTVYCGQDALVVERLVVAGKQEMSGRAFINGYLK